MCVRVGCAGEGEFFFARAPTRVINPSIYSALSGLISVSVPDTLGDEKEIASLFLSLFSFRFLSLVKRGCSLSGLGAFSSEFEGVEHPCNVVPINTSIKNHWYETPRDINDCLPVFKKENPGLRWRATLDSATRANTQDNQVIEICVALAGEEATFLGLIKKTSHHAQQLGPVVDSGTSRCAGN
jgi:hypothetical protein